MKDIYDEHNVGRTYIMPNYQRALVDLEAEKRVVVTPSKRVSRKGRKTLAPDKCQVLFPPNGQA